MQRGASSSPNSQIVYEYNQLSEKCRFELFVDDCDGESLVDEYSSNNNDHRNEKWNFSAGRRRERREG